jgi:hypothetical protein
MSKHSTCCAHELQGSDNDIMPSETFRWSLTLKALDDIRLLPVDEGDNLCIGLCRF